MVETRKIPWTQAGVSLLYRETMAKSQQRTTPDEIYTGGSPVQSKRVQKARNPCICWDGPFDFKPIFHVSSESELANPNLVIPWDNVMHSSQGQYQPHQQHNHLDCRLYQRIKDVKQRYLFRFILEDTHQEVGKAVETMNTVLIPRRSWKYPGTDDYPRQSD
jgi:hypothetical protein